MQTMLLLLISPPPGATITAYMGPMPGTVIYYLVYNSDDQAKITAWIRELHEESIIRQAAAELPAPG